MMDGKPAAADKRHALVVGDEPRIAPLEMDALNDDLSRIIVRMIEVNATLDSRERGQLTGLMSGHSSASDISMQLANLPEVIRTMVRHADLFVRHVDVGLYLLRQGTLSARDRELAILRIGWLCQAPYEWGEHVLVAKKLGMSGSDIESIIEGSAAPGWSEHEQAIIRATEELHADAMILGDPGQNSRRKTAHRITDSRRTVPNPRLLPEFTAAAAARRQSRAARALAARDHHLPSAIRR